MEEKEDRREELEDTSTAHTSNTSKEGTNIILVIMSACVLVMIVVLAALFIFYPSDKKDKTKDLAYGDTSQQMPAPANATAARFSDNGQPTGPAATIYPATDPALSAPPDEAENLNAGKQTAKPAISSVSNIYGDPQGAKDSKESTVPQVVVERAYDPKTGLELDTSLGSPAGNQRTAANNSTLQTNKQNGLNDKTVAANKQTTATHKQAAAKSTASATAQQPHTISVKEYWVQVAAFKSRTRAESLNEKLKQIGYAGTIKTTNIEGETLFRVRLGPYANNSEAEKFRDWIAGIDGLENSYISQSINKKTVN